MRDYKAKLGITGNWNGMNMLPKWIRIDCRLTEETMVTKDSGELWKSRENVKELREYNKTCWVEEMD